MRVYPSVFEAPPIVEPRRMGSRYGLSVATAKPSSFFACSSLMTKPFVRARAAVIAGRELLWHETQERFLNTGSPLVSIKGRIFFTAAFRHGGPTTRFEPSSSDCI